MSSRNICCISLYVYGSIIHMQPLIDQCYGAKNEKDMKYYFHSGLIINIIGGVVINTIVILFLPRAFGGGSIWFAFGIFEAIVMSVAIWLLRRSEKNGIRYA